MKTQRNKSVAILTNKKHISIILWYMNMYTLLMSHTLYCWYKWTVFSSFWVVGLIISVTQPLLYPATHCLSKLRTESNEHKEKSASLLSRCHFNQHTKQCLATKENESLNIPTSPPQSHITRVEHFCLAPQVKLQIYESFTWLVQNWFWFPLPIWTWKYLSDDC
jgi:hypothetical protein